jgi:purine nucleosidase
MATGLSSSRNAHRVRVISDNDYGGDPDGLVQLAHHLLSASVDVRLVVGGQVPTYDPSWSPASAMESEARARELVQLIGREDVPIVAGSNDALSGPTEPQMTAAAEAIVQEAMRDDTEVPLFVTCGGSLTNIASAWLMEPRIAERLTLLWIGGREYDDLADPLPRALPVEYNTSIDIVAAQVVFNTSSLVLWQVPQNVYRQVLASRAELLLRMRPQGEVGEHLFRSLDQFADAMQAYGLPVGETFILGDSPLVLLSALHSSFSPSPSSSEWIERPRFGLLDSGHYDSTRIGPTIRIFTRLDTRLLMEDLYAKLSLHHAMAPG